MKYNKIIVVGCPGAGKSTFSKKLAKKTNLPLYHLDMINWKPDGTTIVKNELIKKQKDIISTEKWIIDGNYGSTIKLRLEACDLVYFLDLPTEICLRGVMERNNSYRSDMPCESKNDEEFISFIKAFNEESRPKIFELLKKYPDKCVIIFNNHKEIDEYINTLNDCL